MSTEAYSAAQEARRAQRSFPSRTGGVAGFSPGQLGMKNPLVIQHSSGKWTIYRGFTHLPIIQIGISGSSIGGT